MKKCPPNVICIENYVLLFIIICLIALFTIIYMVFQNVNNKQITNKNNIIIHEQQNPNSNKLGYIPSYPYSNIPNPDVLLNPYVPPLRDERYFMETNLSVPRIPINISTSAVDTNYRQVGILTPMKKKHLEKILPLMGRPLFTRRDLWQYYSMSDSNNSVKLPIIVNGKSATNEYGVNQIYNGTKVFVEGYNEPFKVTIYDNDVIKYIPFF